MLLQLVLNVSPLVIVFLWFGYISIQLWYVMSWYNMVCHRLLLHITVSYDMLWYGMLYYGMVCYIMVWYGMVMLAGRLWSDYVRPVPSLPSPLPGPVTYVTPEHNADSVTTNSTSGGRPPPSTHFFYSLSTHSLLTSADFHWLLLTLFLDRRLLLPRVETMTHPLSVGSRDAGASEHGRGLGCTLAWMSDFWGAD